MDVCGWYGAPMKRDEDRDLPLTGKACLVVGDGLAATVATVLESHGARLVHEQSLPTTGEGAQATIASARKSLAGELDVLVAAPQFREDCAFPDISDELWQRSINENLRSAFLVAREAARVMAARGTGTIVHVTSTLAARPAPGTAGYAATKAAVNLLTVGMALDLAPHGVRVCAVAPPERTEAGDAPADSLTDEDIARAVAFCASDDASYVVGSTFYLDGPLPTRY